MVANNDSMYYSFAFPFNIYNCDYIEDETPHITNNPISQCYAFEYINRGEGTLICNDKVYHLEKGDLFILPKGSNYQYFPDIKRPWSRLRFSADGILVSNLIVSYGLHDVVMVKNFGGERLFKEILELSRKMPDENALYESSIKFHEILQKIYAAQSRNIPQNNALAIKKILDSSLYKHDFTMKDVSKILGISKAQIISIFREKFGETPYKYLIQQRIQLSAEMLLNTDMSIKEISDTFCFSDQHYYANVFKKITGSSPNQYRKERTELYNTSSEKRGN